ncbi:tRNA adenosine(34) deaminase TadA [Rheinheimera sp. MMS21-TC3]|uniref:tRNA adenosine(34) deaminase TadA n=1 Tax=Rheinheimera sp. MMS21-TC3 TaxID=3072790 RepID=UPI0028C4DB15|nr:tRNA adenosine(34) deaminase TadA [Rheinheimera sp. MMS21-TC3]WNO59971.1 tRNA adenosine(34) deaminase TadA [Rheinheimera sp. MMS21-TC3]
MNDETWMRHAIDLAAKAEAIGEVPVGAVLVKDNQLIAEGWNQMISTQDPSAHAEMQAIRAGAKKLNNYRLTDCTLYITLEPCSMCSGLMVHSRIKRVVFGTHDLKTGAAGSVLNIVQQVEFNHQLEVVSGVLAQQCSEQLSAFFRRRRAEIKAARQQTLVGE